MRSLPAFLGSALLCLSLLGAGCSKQSKDTTPAPAPATQPAAATTPAEAPPPQGIAVGEPNPADPTPARPPSVTDAEIVTADKLIAVVGKLADGVNKAGADCQAVAAHIRAITPEVKLVAEEGKKMESKLNGDPAAKDWFEKTYGPKAQARMGGMMTSPCLNDPAVSQALQALNF